MWQDHASCRDMDPRIFFPDSRDSALNRAFVREARRTCAACPVKVECGEFSQTSNNGRPEQWGVWSGRDMGPKKKAEPKDVPAWKRAERSLEAAAHYRTIVCATCGEQFRWKPDLLGSYQPPETCSKPCRTQLQSRRRVQAAKARTNEAICG